MDRGAWQATQRVRHNLVTKPPNLYWGVFIIFSVIDKIHYFKQDR